jgi:electron transport complex protein RnfE
MQSIRKLVSTVQEHPVCLASLGLSPLVMKCETFTSALMISMAFSLALVLSGLTVCGVRKLVSGTNRLLMVLVITSGWVTVIDLAWQAWFYEMRLFIGIYIPVIAMNSLLLMVLQGEALQTSLDRFISRVWFIPCTVILICIATGSAREILTRGVLFSDFNLVMPALDISGLKLLPAAMTLPLFQVAAGAFIVLGCMIALINNIFRKSRSS